MEWVIVHRGNFGVWIPTPAPTPSFQMVIKGRTSLGHLRPATEIAWDRHSSCSGKVSNWVNLTSLAGFPADLLCLRQIWVPWEHLEFCCSFTKIQGLGYVLEKVDFVFELWSNKKWAWICASTLRWGSIVFLHVQINPAVSFSPRKGC